MNPSERTPMERVKHYSVTYNPDPLEQVVEFTFKEHTDAGQTVLAHAIMDLKKRSVRAALIDWGWMPPKSEDDKLFDEYRAGLPSEITKQHRDRISSHKFFDSVPEFIHHAYRNDSLVRRAIEEGFYNGESRDQILIRLIVRLLNHKQNLESQILRCKKEETQPAIIKPPMDTKDMIMIPDSVMKAAETVKNYMTMHKMKSLCGLKKE